MRAEKRRERRKWKNVRLVSLLRTTREISRGELKMTPLHFASAYGQAEAVSFLVQRKCEMEIFDSDGCTALIKAAQNENEECVAILLEGGSIANMGNHKGMTALHYAAQNNNITIAGLLIAHRANIESRNKKGQTPLMMAARQNNKEMVELLIENQANIHAVDRHGRTSLMLAVKCEAIDIVYILLREGMDIFTQDKSGRNMIDFAYNCSFKVKKEIMDYFKNKPKHVHTEKPEPKEVAPKEGPSMMEEKEIQDTEYNEPKSKCNAIKIKVREVWEPDPSTLYQQKYGFRRLRGTIDYGGIASLLSETGMSMPGMLSSGNMQKIPNQSSSLPDLRGMSESVSFKSARAGGRRAHNAAKGHVCESSVKSGHLKSSTDPYAPGIMNDIIRTFRSEPPTGVATEEEQGRLQDTVSKQLLNILQRNRSKSSGNSQPSRPNDTKYVDRSEGQVTSSDSCAFHLEPTHSKNPAEAQRLSSPSSSLADPKNAEFVYKPSLAEMPSKPKYSELSSQNQAFSETEDEVLGQQRALPETEEQKSMLQHEDTAWKQEISSLSRALKEEERRAHHFRDQMKAYLKEREQQYEEEMEQRKKHEMCISILAKELKAVKGKVIMNCKEKDQLQELCTLQEAMSIISKDISTMKIEIMEREKKFLGEIDILKKQNTDLQRANRLKDETFAKETCQHKTKLNSLIAKNMKLSAQLEKRF